MFNGFGIAVPRGGGIHKWSLLLPPALCKWVLYCLSHVRWSVEWSVRLYVWDKLLPCKDCDRKRKTFFVQRLIKAHVYVFNVLFILVCMSRTEYSYNKFLMLGVHLLFITQDALATAYLTGATIPEKVVLTRQSSCVTARGVPPTPPAWSCPKTHTKKKNLNKRKKNFKNKKIWTKKKMGEGGGTEPHRGKVLQCIVEKVPRHAPPPPCEQTEKVKTLPSLKLRLWAVTNRFDITSG